MTHPREPRGPPGPRSLYQRLRPTEVGMSVDFTDLSEDFRTFLEYQDDLYYREGIHTIVRNNGKTYRNIDNDILERISFFTNDLGGLLPEIRKSKDVWSFVHGNRELLTIDVRLTHQYGMATLKIQHELLLRELLKEDFLFTPSNSEEILFIIETDHDMWEIILENELLKAFSNTRCVFNDSS